MNLMCRAGLHRYEHCKCTRCGARRDAEHVWNGCKCTICGKTRDESHRWNGCVCTICGLTRDKEHNWDGCKCTICGKKRDEGHLWDACVCKKCGAIRSYETDQDGKIRNVHDWDGCMCRKCKFTRNEGHQMPPDLLAKELAKSTARVKILTPGLNLKFQCLRCKRNVTLKGGYDYCPNCLGVVDSTLEYTDSPTIMKRVYDYTKCDYWAETTFSDSY